MKKFKSPMVLEIRLEKINVDKKNGIQYSIYLGEFYIDSFYISHSIKKVTFKLDEDKERGFGIKYNNNLEQYEVYCSFFELTPPITKQEAIEQLNAIIDEANGDWVADWENCGQAKHSISFAIIAKDTS